MDLFLYEVSIARAHRASSPAARAPVADGAAEMPPNGPPEAAAAMTPLAERPPLRDVQRARNDAIMNLAVEAIRKQQGSLNVWYV
jgi:hypothetical protein